MADKLKEIPAKILEWWNKFTTRQKSIIIGAAAVVIFAFAIIMYVMSKPQYVRLVTCETTAQASEIIDTLDSAGIAHRESNDGLKIDVESSKQSAANLALGSAGYVPDALNLNDYLGNSMSTTATDKERLYNSYLEQYITQTIEAQSAVKSAKVHLSFPKDNGTLAAQNEEASAFIQLELDGTFTSANAAALAKCVATWLRNDTTANITIMDTDSNLLFAGVGSLGTDAFTYDNAMDYFAVRDESGKVTGLLMDAVCMAKATTLGFTPQSIESYEQYFEIIFDEEKNLGAIEKARGEINEALGTPRSLRIGKWVTVCPLTGR